MFGGDGDDDGVGILTTYVTQVVGSHLLIITVALLSLLTFPTESEEAGAMLLQNQPNSAVSDYTQTDILFAARVDDRFS